MCHCTILECNRQPPQLLCHLMRFRKRAFYSKSYMAISNTKLSCMSAEMVCPRPHGPTVIGKGFWNITPSTHPHSPSSPILQEYGELRQATRGR